jgi:hypothetical protein
MHGEHGIRRGDDRRHEIDEEGDDDDQRGDAELGPAEIVVRRLGCSPVHPTVSPML